MLTTAFYQLFISSGCTQPERETMRLRLGSPATATLRLRGWGLTGNVMERCQQDGEVYFIILVAHERLVFRSPLDMLVIEVAELPVVFGNLTTRLIELRIVAPLRAL